MTSISSAILLIAITLGLWALILFGGYVYGRMTLTGDYSIPTIARLGSSLMLVLAAWIEAVLLPHSHLAVFPWLIALGMTSGCIGDLFLADILPVPQAFLFGMAAFAIGHIWYIAAFWQFASSIHVSAAQHLVPIMLWLAIALAGWYGILMYHRHATLLNWIALPYALLLSGTASSTFSAALVLPAMIPATIGAILFLISDMIIAANTFADIHFSKIGDAIWLTYGPAQALIVITPLIAVLALGV